MNKKTITNRKIVIGIILIILCAIAIVLRVNVYTPNYFWTNDLCEAIHKGDMKRVDKLL